MHKPIRAQELERWAALGNKSIHAGSPMFACIALPIYNGNLLSIIHPAERDELCFLSNHQKLLSREGAKELGIFALNDRVQNKTK